MSSEPETQPNSFLNGIKSRVGNVQVFQTGDKIGVSREIEQASDADDPSGSPIAEPVKKARESLQEDNHDTRFDLYDAMVDLDPELSGATHAMSQSASKFTVVPPVDEPSERGQKAVEECRTLTWDILDGEALAVDVMHNIIKDGNDISKKVYSKGDGIRKVQALPVNSVTIVDDVGDIQYPDTVDESNAILDKLKRDKTDLDGDNDGELNEVFSRDAYVLGEMKSNDPSIIAPYDVLHFSIDSRTNWFTDRVGRETFGVWGRSRLEPLRFTIQTKYNTLTNKVAMDDKLLAREIYYIDTTSLFGDINDFEERKKKAKTYAKELRGMIENLGPDERPILPDDVEVKIIGPEGKAIDQQPFLEQLNNAIAAALTFPMAGMGRGTTSVKAGEEISSLWAENNIANLRKTLIRGFREIFRDHLKLKHPEWVENGSEASNLGEMKLDPDIEVPTLEYEPFREQDMTEKARQIKLLHQTKTASRAERRELFGLPTNQESLEKVEKEYQKEGQKIPNQHPNRDSGEEENAESSDSADNEESADGAKENRGGDDAE